MKKTIFTLLALLLTCGLSATKVTKTVTQLAAAYEWTGEGTNFYTSFDLDDVIHVEAAANPGGNPNGNYNTQWRMYQARNNGQFSISAAEGYWIKSIKLTYSVTNTGVLSTVTGSNLTEGTIPSGTAYEVNAQSITLYVGNTSTATNGQVRITNFEVTYYHPTVTVVFHMNDGAEPETTLDVTATYGATMPANAATSWTRENYTLNNFWLTSDAQEGTRITKGAKWVKGRTNYTDNDDTNPKWIYEGEGPVHVYANWVENPKTIVHFDANGGDASASFDLEVYKGTRVSILSAEDVTGKLTRSGYTFDNYYTAEEGGQRMTNVAGSGKLWFVQGAREGYLDASGNWIMDGGEVTFYAHWTPNTPAALTLNDNEDNAATLSALDGETRDVTIHRSFSSAYYNTICLPFDLSAEQIATAFGAGTVWKTLSAASLEGDMLNLNFMEASSIEAGVPYLIQPAANTVNPTFAGVTISASTENTVTTDVDFVGLFSPAELTAEDHSTLFLTTGNELVFPSATGNLLGFRAYFHVKGAATVAARARIVTAAATPTGIENENANADCKIVRDGQVLILREGKYYSLQGMTIE